jgi:hypothetical protein
VKQFREANASNLPRSQTWTWQHNRSLVLGST